ncbi:MAG: hypothetical protein U5L72_09485 [Bacteroidales bacterium]|nr:hypothetical protein [Bacteroidales bacterium]
MERFIRDIGYYAFSTENIYFRIDSAPDEPPGHCSVCCYTQDNPRQPGPARCDSNHRMYRVRDVYVFPDFDPRLSLTLGEAYTMTFDTTVYKGIHFVALPGRMTIKPEVLAQALYVSPGALFSETNARQTETHLVDLKNHRLVNVSYVDAESLTGERRDAGLLYCIIQLTPMMRQSFTIELEGTNSGGNLGGALNLIYQNKSLFGGAEVFSMKLKGAYETLTDVCLRIQKYLQQYGFEANLRLPKFLLPIPEKEKFIRDHDPRTVFQAGYNYQMVPVYARSVANVALGYSWSGNKYTKFNISPLSFNVVKLHFIEPEFQAMIDTTSSCSFSLPRRKDCGRSVRLRL